MSKLRRICDLKPGDQFMVSGKPATYHGLNGNYGVVTLAISPTKRRKTKQVHRYEVHPKNMQREVLVVP